MVRDIETCMLARVIVDAEVPPERRPTKINSLEELLDVQRSFSRIGCGVNWEPGFEDSGTPHQLGWRHGCQDRYGSFNYRPGCKMLPGEFEEYKTGYRKGRR